MKLKSTLIYGCAVSALMASAYENKTESRAYFATNPANGVGKAATITIDGKLDDWSEDMMIARNGANNMSTAFKGTHENNVIDIYAIYAAWDDQNLYVAWQMCNTGDTWARPGDGPLTDYGKPGDIPFIVALSVDPSSQAMTGKLEDGKCVWVDDAGMGTTFDMTSVHVDHMLFMSGKPGQGVPGIFTPVNAKGDTNYGAGCTLFSAAGVSYDRADGFLPAELWRQKTTADYDFDGTLISDPSCIEAIYDSGSYQNIINNDVEGLKPHDTAYDTFYEIKIPLKVLGITRQWLEANGIGCRVIGTRGESAIDCCPFDPAMIDNAFECYGKDASTTGEKDDLDIITYAMADIAKVRDLSNIEPLPDPTPDPDPDPTPDPDPDPTPDPDPAPVDGSYAIYYIGTNYSTPYTYIWDSGDGDKEYSGKWPGSAMTKVTVNGREMWRYTFLPENPLITPMVIFNSGNGAQTKNLELINHGIYDDNGYTGNNVNVSTGVELNYAADSSEAVWFDMQGHRLDGAPANQGIYIRVAAGKAQKVMVTL